jgi:transposase-like protein
MGLGRVRLRAIDRSHPLDELFEFIRDNVAHGSILYTDGETSYLDITRRLQRRHEPITLATSTIRAHEVLPAVHQVASLLKRWLAGTLHYGQIETHLDDYLDEFTFRFNRNTSHSRGLPWYRLVDQAVNTDPHPYDVLTHKIYWALESSRHPTHQFEALVGDE